MARTTRRSHPVIRTENPRRAALELLGMLVVAGALLAAPFVYLALRIDADR